MDASEFLAQLEKIPTRSNLSASDLEMMGKRASVLYLDRDVSLNEAVLKIASEHGGVTDEQIRRVVEYANTATFRNLREKQASDKNIHFQIADPEEVLRSRSDSSDRPILKVASLDYAAPPPKTKTAALKHDFELAQAFGLDMVKSAAFANMSQQELTDPSAYVSELPATENALGKGMEFANSALEMGRETGSFEAFSKVLDSVKATARNLERPEPPSIPQGIDPSTLQPATHSAPRPPISVGGSPIKMAEFMFPPMSDAPMPMMPMQPMEPMNPIQAIQPMMMGDFANPYQPTMGMGGAMMPMQMGMGMPMSPGGMGQMDPSMYDPMSGAMFPKTAEEVREHIKGEKPRSATELAIIKDKLDRCASEVNADKNNCKGYIKQAEDQLTELCAQHILMGGSAGEVFHALSPLDGEHLKTASEAIVVRLQQHRVDMHKVAADVAQYDVRHHGAQRMPNPENVIVKTAAKLAQLRQDEMVFEKAASDLNELRKEVLKVYRKVAR